MTPPGCVDCVVDAKIEQLIIWHVDTGPTAGFTRLVGAWVLHMDEADKVELLVTGRRALITEAGRHALHRLGVSVAAYIDPMRTADALRTAQDELQAVYDAQGRASLVPPSWPPSLETIDMSAPPRAASCEPTQVALALANWLARVATTWDRIEAQRVARKYMPGGATRRPTPVFVRQRCDRG